METAASAAFTSWTLDWRVVMTLAASLLFYLRGWILGRRLIHDPDDFSRLLAFTAGIVVVFLAVCSPLDSFDSLFLSAHMAQHLLLMMLAPPLLLLGKPFVPLLRGLPKVFVKEGLAPFLTWPDFKRFALFVTAPLVAWLVFAGATVLWHLPFFYELALHSSLWHGIQHASFFWSGILFWWPILERRSKYPAWVFIPYLLLADFVNTGLSAVFVFSGRSLYPSYDLVRASNFKAADDQILAGLIMWVPGSIIYLVPAFLLAMRVFAGRLQGQGSGVHRVKGTLPLVASQQAFQTKGFSFFRTGYLLTVARQRRWLQAIMLVLSMVVMCDGWFGRQVTPMNLAGMLPWIYWRGLSVFALLTVGNLFCMACPFTLVRDMGRKILPANRRWPHALRNKWMAGGIFVLYLWAYEALGLWDSPWLTAWIIAGYFLAALLIDGVFRGATFCKYICPIGQFHFVVSSVSPREIAPRQAAVCQSCKTFDCIKGNQQARGCELDLFVPKKIGNLDCTLCLDCVKACPHDNVALLSITPDRSLLSDAHRSSIGRLGRRWDWIVLAELVTFGAFVNAGAMVNPVMMWEHGWHARFGMHSMPWIVAAFVLAGTIVTPAILITLCGWLSTGMKTVDAIRKFALVLVPLGVGMWAAHVAYHALGAWIPDVTPLEILLLGAGLLLSLYLIWKAARQSFLLAAPWAALAVGMYGIGLWILFQPMQMRGMM